MLTLKSTAETVPAAAANAVMLAQDLGQNVLLQWQKKEVLVFAEDTTKDVVRIMTMSGCGTG